MRGRACKSQDPGAEEGVAELGPLRRAMPSGPMLVQMQGARPRFTSCLLTQPSASTYLDTTSTPVRHLFDTTSTQFDPNSTLIRHFFGTYRALRRAGQLALRSAPRAQSWDTEQCVVSRRLWARGYHTVCGIGRGAGYRTVCGIPAASRLAMVWRHLPALRHDLCCIGTYGRNT